MVFETIMQPTINHYGDFRFEVKGVLGYKVREAGQKVVFSRTRSAILYILTAVSHK